MEQLDYIISVETDGKLKVCVRDRSEVNAAYTPTTPDELKVTLPENVYKAYMLGLARLGDVAGRMDHLDNLRLLVESLGLTALHIFCISTGTKYVCIYDWG